MHKRGFTLVELMVVIAIIGLLASVILASLNVARTKARVATLGEQTRQFSQLFLLDHEDLETYQTLWTGTWVGYGAADCDDYFGSSPRVQEARNICHAIESNGSRMYVAAGSLSYVLIVWRADGTIYHFCYNHRNEHTDEGYVDIYGIWVGAGCTDT